jgi:hypothetical protein
MVLHLERHWERVRELGKELEKEQGMVLNLGKSREQVMELPTEKEKVQEKERRREMEKGRQLERWKEQKLAPRSELDMGSKALLHR